MMSLNFQAAKHEKMIVAMTGIPVVAKVRHGDQELAMDAAELAGLYR